MRKGEGKDGGGGEGESEEKGVNEEVKRKEECEVKCGVGWSMWSWCDFGLIKSNHEIDRLRQYSMELKFLTLTNSK